MSDQISQRLEEEELSRKPFTVKCAFLYDIYGIVKIEKSSDNKDLQLYLLVTFLL